MGLNKSSSLDNSRSSKITEIEDTVKPLNKTRSISSASINDKLRSDTPSVSSMSVHGASITAVSSYKDLIPRKDIKKKIS